VIRSWARNLPRLYPGAVHENEEIDVLATVDCDIRRILATKRNLIKPMSTLSGRNDTNCIEVPMRSGRNHAVEYLACDRLGATGRERRDFFCGGRPLGRLANILERNPGPKVLIADITVSGISAGPLLPVRQ
jgi:hypothetical protein